MLRPYREILSKPGALAFSSAGALARLPMSMVTLSIILLVTSIYGEYALAGRVAAAYVIAQALCAPQLAKFIDSYGQARVMRPALLLAIVSLVGLMGAVLMHAPEPALYLVAAAAGASIGSMGALVRSRWSNTVSTPRELHVAFSLESALDELLFVIGPVLATFLATSISPIAGLLVAIAASALGGFWFLGQRATEPTPSGRLPAGVRRSSIASWGLVVVAIVFVTMGVIFGATDVATVAYAEDQGRKGLAGLLLAVFALGSLLSGIIYGAQHFTSATWKRFVVGVIALAVAVSLFVLSSNLWFLAIVMFIAGFAIAPTIITGNALVQELVPPERLTEGLTWVGTSIGVGFALGTPIAGAVVDARGGHDGFLVVVAAATVSTIVAVLAIPVLRRSAPRY